MCGGEPDKCDAGAICCLKLYSRSYNYIRIARETEYKDTAVKRYIITTLDGVIENTPAYLLSNIPTEFTQFRMGGCPHGGVG